MIVKNYKPINKGFILGSFTLEVKGGLQIRSCTLFKKGDRQWVSMPQREYEKDGERKYFSYVGYEDKEVYNQFMKEALKLALAESVKASPSAIAQGGSVQEEEEDSLPF